MADDMITPPTEGSSAPATSRWRRFLPSLLVALVAVVLNFLAYWLMPPQIVDYIGQLGYLGAFLITLIANATVIIPVPYFGIVARLAQQLDPVIITLAGALGSVLGESVAYLVGRSGRQAVDDTRLYHWVQQQMRHPWRAWFILFAFAAPPNPAFDVAGLAAGAMGLPYWLFFSAVFLGRIIRIGLIVLAGIGLLGAG